MCVTEYLKSTVLTQFSVALPAAKSQSKATFRGQLYAGVCVGLFMNFLVRFLSHYFIRLWYYRPSSYYDDTIIVRVTVTWLYTLPIHEYNCPLTLFRLSVGTDFTVIEDVSQRITPKKCVIMGIAVHCIHSHQFWLKVNAAQPGPARLGKRRNF